MTIEGIFQEALRSHSFSQNTKQLQRIFVPGVRGGGSKLAHSGGLVASKEGAGLKPSLYMQTTGTERAKKMLG